MTRRVSIIGIALVAMTAASAHAQQQFEPSLADVARKAEAAKPTVKKATKSYTNSNLSSMPAEPAPTVARPGVLSNATPDKAGAAKDAPAKDAGAVELTKAEEEAKAKQAEEQWRGRANSLRLQIDKAQLELATLTRPNPARDADAYAQSRNDVLVKNLQANLDRLKKGWARLEDDARENKISTAWLEPRPRF